MRRNAKIDKKNKSFLDKAGIKDQMVKMKDGNKISAKEFYELYGKIGGALK